MANIRSAKKRILVNRRQAESNGRRRSRVRTLIKKAQSVIDSKDKKGAYNMVCFVDKEIQRGRAKGILHKNTAARRQSRLARMLHRAHPR
ncbi:MAG: 30S ribosomal protein S20 [Alphaproteobacteria bacterium GM7ARS4]|nr:30S ribosomal protein S20 [Alphaproteobacteria bacterium GM7ARS4]